MTIISLIIGVLCGAGIIYVILSPKVKEVQSINEEIKRQNAAVESELINLKNEKQKVLIEIETLKQRNEDLNQSYQNKYNEYHKLREDCERESRQAESSAQKYYDKMMDIQKKKLEYDLKTERKKYENAIEEYRKEYASVLFGAVNEFQTEMTQKRAELNLLKNTLADEKSKVLAAIDANKRAEEIEIEGNFYKLNLSEEDLQEIKTLRECFNKIKNPEPLNKVIWKVYYEKPYTDLIGRVVGSGIHCGIYKITNIKNGMCYVGQAVNISDRWKQHIKRGMGAETPTRNKLYPAMLSVGVENFTFEIIEECSREQLNEKEDYWQEYFKAKEFGYSIK